MMSDLTPIEWFGYIWLCVMVLAWLFVRGAKTQDALTEQIIDILTQRGAMSTFHLWQCLIAKDGYSLGQYHAALAKLQESGKVTITETGERIHERGWRRQHIVRATPGPGDVIEVVR